MVAETKYSVNNKNVPLQIKDLLFSETTEIASTICASFEIWSLYEKAANNTDAYSANGVA